MRDFENDRKKNLDLVLCTPASGRVARNARTLRSYAKEKGIVLSEEEQRLLDDLPELLETPVGSVEIALEAKAVMTAHVKALPRLYDELNSSQLTIHGASDLAINVSESFVNTQGTTNLHSQSSDTVRVVEKVKQLPRRTSTNRHGFDAFGIVAIDMKNDGTSPVRLATEPPALPPGDICHYDSMIQRVVQLYEGRFPRA